MLKHPTKQNLPPGTMIYTGHYKEETFKSELISYHEDEFSEKSGSQLELSVMDISPGVKWLNVVGLADVEKIREIGVHYHIDPMVLEDIVHVEQRTKLEVYENYCFAVFKMIYQKADNGAMTNRYVHEHLSLLLLPQMVITFQETPDDVFDSVRNRIRKSSGKIRSLGSDYLFFALIDAVVDHQMDAMSSLQNEVDFYEKLVIDDKMFEIEKLHHIRKMLLMLKSAVLPEQEILMRLQSIEDHEIISNTVNKYFKDVEDHVVHLSDRIIMYREMVSGLFEMNQTHMSNHMNDIMMILTIFSAIFIPLSFLAGFFGMNFTVFPGLASPNGILYFVIACIVIALTMLGFFKWRRWF